MFSTILEIPRGKIFLAKTEKGLSLATFIRNKGQLKEIERFLNRKGIALQADHSRFRLEERLFKKYFEGKEEDFTFLPLDFVSGTPYQRKVWLEARKIPYGKTTSYKSLAQRLNHRGYRSIGQAIGRNPLLIVIPCHRVIRSDGGLGGFGLGLDFKEYLLRLERGERPV